MTHDGVVLSHTQHDSEDALQQIYNEVVIGPAGIRAMVTVT